MMTTDRRSFLRSLSSVLVAPAIVRASSLMAISPVPVEPWSRSIWVRLDVEYMIRFQVDLERQLVRDAGLAA